MKKTILLIDDDKNMLRLLEFVLKKDYETISSNDPVDALKLFDKLPIDAVIADLEMPTLSGYDVITAIREEKQEHFMPILILSGHEKSEERVKSLTLGADDYLVKPFNPEELKARLISVFRRVNFVNELKKEALSR